MATRFRMGLAMVLALMAMTTLAAVASAETPDGTTIEVIQVVTSNDTEAVFIGGGFAMDGGHWCRTGGITLRATASGPASTKCTPNTYFCWDGGALAHTDPEVSHGVNDVAFLWQITDSDDNETGEVGDWKHWDRASWTFRRCMMGQCFDTMHVWIEKEQFGDGTATIAHGS